MRRPHHLLAIAAAMVLLSILILGFTIQSIRSDMNPAEPIAAEKPLRAAPARATGPKPTRTALTVRVVDSQLAPVAAAEVSIGEGMEWTDPEGFALVDEVPVGFHNLVVRDDSNQLASVYVDVSGEAQEVQVMVHARCPGPVLILRNNQPFAGRARAYGWEDIPPDGIVDMPYRPCGRFRLSVSEPKLTPVRQFRTLVGRAEGEELVVVHYNTDHAREEESGGPPPRQVAVELVCDQCPDIVRCGKAWFPNRMDAPPCTGEIPHLRCTCPGGRALLFGETTDAIWDWQLHSDLLGAIAPEVDQILIDLNGDRASVSARWTGPLPCAASLTRTGGTERSRSWVDCDTTGHVFVEDLAPGPWSMDLGWTGGGRAIDFYVAKIELRVGQNLEIDLGEVGPGDQRQAR